MKNELAYWMMSHAGSAGHWNKETRNEVKDYTDRQRERERERESQTLRRLLCLSLFLLQKLFPHFSPFFPFCLREGVALWHFGQNFLPSVFFHVHFCLSSLQFLCFTLRFFLCVVALLGWLVFLNVFTFVVVPCFPRSFPSYFS
jgi:membrane glycosyltransferase